MTNFVNYRNSDGTIDLIKLYQDKVSTVNPAALGFLKNIRDIHPIKSRQVAAITVATAMALK